MGWYLGDTSAELGALADEWPEAMCRFPAGSVLPAGGVVVVAQQAPDVGFVPHLRVSPRSQPRRAGAPSMVRVDPRTGDGLAPRNDGDEVVLRNAEGTVYVVTYSSGILPGVVVHPGVVNRCHSLERRPSEWKADEGSQGSFDRCPPTPGVLPWWIGVGLPSAFRHGAASQMPRNHERDPQTLRPRTRPPCPRI